VYGENDVTKPVDNNPKTAAGIKKPPLSRVPPSALIYASLAMNNGAQKYGAYNWREKDVTASIYIDACLRHLGAWFDGEEFAEDSGVPHLAHAVASLCILIDAAENGNLIDDRPVKGPAAKLIKEWTND
jgi:hypothetical protein